MGEEQGGRRRTVSTEGLPKARSVHSLCHWQASDLFAGQKGKAPQGKDLGWDHATFSFKATSSEARRPLLAAYQLSVVSLWGHGLCC